MSLDRRRLLLGLGASTVAGAFLPRARAQTRPAARRLIVVFTPNGSILSRWRPSGSEASFSFPAGSILEPLAPHKDRLVVVDGLDFANASNHEGGMSATLTGLGGASTETGGASVDQFVAARLGQDTRFASLELGVATSAWGGSVQTRMSYRGAGELVAPNDDPADVFRRLFGNAAPEGDPAAAKRLRRQRSVLDVLRQDLRELDRRLPMEERRKLAQHLEALRQLEVSLSAEPAAPGASCTPPAPPRASGFVAQGRAQMDLLVLALACGATRVASLQWSHTVSPLVMDWLQLGESHHELSHASDGDGARVEGFVKAERWFAEQQAYLLDRLAGTPEPGGEGSLLDHSLLVWAKEMGDSRLHECRSVPFVLAGGAGGALRPGRYLRYPGQPHNRLLVSICRALGLDNDSFGDPAPGRGPLPGLLAI